MEKELTCAFTGHRPSSYRFGYDEEHPDCVTIKIHMTAQIGALIRAIPHNGKKFPHHLPAWVNSVENSCFFIARAN